jgi:hypothetical protein
MTSVKLFSMILEKFPYDLQKNTVITVMTRQVAQKIAQADIAVAYQAIDYQKAESKSSSFTASFVMTLIIYER